MTYGDLTPDQREYLAGDEAFLASLESAYEAAMRGADHPKAMFVCCDECRKGFLLVKGAQNEVCTHILAKFMAEPRKMKRVGPDGMTAEDFE